MGTRKQIISVGFVSLGCPKNSVDSERMLAEIAQAGFAITGQADNADVVVVNTCGFIAPAEAESLEAIRHAADCKSKGSVRKVIVAGCLGERLGPELLEKVSGIDAVVSLDQRDNIAEIIRNVLAGDVTGSPPCATPPEPHFDRVPDDRTRLLITPGHWAYLRISEGCNRRCSYCTIPAIRGPFRSKPVELVLAEATELASAGVLELNVIAQDTTYYGRDLNMKNGLAALVRRLDKVAGIEWIRLMYLYPTGIDAELIETIATSRRTVRYLDIPLQHVSGSILKSMRRPDTPEALRRLIETLRRAMPDIVLRTTLMVGFPGETDREFSELLDFVRWARFDALGCFKFYPESGTAAAEMPAQVADKVKKQRLKELMLAQQEIAFAKNERRIGSELRCLVDSVDSNGLGCGRFYGQAPDIDSVCIIENCSAAPGQFADTKVLATEDYDLRVGQI
ncbi:MAG: 30S ribosomal protein S12 methylthiotransferase RimO [Planctomycetota bacterium]|jgi:ribosomal protein S12 methylthiotransferase